MNDQHLHQMSHCSNGKEPHSTRTGSHEFNSLLHNPLPPQTRDTQIATIAASSHQVIEI